MEKKLVIMAGLPGSGKSYVRSNRYEDMEYVDCDEIKKCIAGYDAKNPGSVHAQSKVMEALVIHKMLGEGKSFVYDTTATNWAKLVKLIKDVKALGYVVELCYVRVSLKTALKRNASRERVVPDQLIHEKHALMSTALEVLMGYVDSFVTVNND